MRKRENKRKRPIILYILLAVFLLAAGYFVIRTVELGPKGQQAAESNNSSQSNGSSESPNSIADTSAPATNGTGTANPQTSVETTPSSGSSEVLQKQINEMSLEEKVGQLVIVGVEAYENDQYSKLLIEKYHVGGFIIFKKNILNTSQLLGLLNSLKDTNAARNGIPLFLSVDEEGGRVSRLPKEFKKFPTNQMIGKKNDSALSGQIGSVLGEELSAFGFNMNFAPVLDINSNPKNPIIGNRSFGATAQLVSELGVATMKGIQSQNVIAVVKHFPGHGDTSVDSHIGLPKVEHDLERLKSFELKPFASAVENGADAVMVAHILLPELDASYPASISKPVITDLLRGEMGFGGVVMTDDFTMGAVTKNYDFAKAAVRAINAGGDIVLVCHGFDKQEKVLKALFAAVKTGQISEERLNQSLYRILELKQKYSLQDNPAGEVAVQRINAKIQELLENLSK